MTLILATTMNFTVQTACHPDDVKTYDTAKLRERFVMEKVMVPDEINVAYTMYDRLIYGGALGRGLGPRGRVRVFLCSPAAAYIHGAILPVDGGWLAR